MTLFPIDDERTEGGHILTEMLSSLQKSACSLVWPACFDLGFLHLSHSLHINEEKMKGSHAKTNAAFQTRAHIGNKWFWNVFEIADLLGQLAGVEVVWSSQSTDFSVPTQAWISHYSW